MKKIRGVALIAVLSVLTVLGILAATLAVMMRLEAKVAETQMDSLKLNLLLDAGVEHAKALARATDIIGEASSPGLYNGDLLLASFGEFPDGKKTRQNMWIPVKNDDGHIIGRYKLVVEDESAKVNINDAWMLTESKGSGWTPGEVSLAKSLGIPPAIVERIVQYRYGANAVPGARGDDDNNNVQLMMDGIDNDADGIIDEIDEGINDPGEYDPYAPKGDDRAFGSVTEVLNVLTRGLKNIDVEKRHLMRRELPRRATLYSIDSVGSASLPNDEPCDVNAMTARQCRKRLITANRIQPFERQTRNLDSLSANISDYRDENHVLTTVASTYGVEAINFNELLANDGTVSRNTMPVLGHDDNTIDQDADDYVIGLNGAFINFDGPGQISWDKDDWEYYRPRDDDDGTGQTGSNYKRGAWDVEILSGRRVRLLGPAWNWERDREMWSTRRRADYDKYLEMRSSTQYGPSKRNYQHPFYKSTHTYDVFELPENILKNLYISIAACPGNSINVYDTGSPNTYQTSPQKYIKIVSSAKNGTLTLADSVDDVIANITQTNGMTRAIIWGWTGQASCAEPRMPLLTTFQNLEPNTYYIPVANNWSNHKRLDEVAKAGFAPLSKLFRDDREPKDHKLFYGGDKTEEFETIRTTSRGIADVYYITGSDTVYDPNGGLEYSGWCSFWGCTFMRPEVIELINVSPRAISLRNWTLTFNSGSVANDIGVISYGQGYALNGERPDSNPVIAGNGYFYLVNNIKLFNAEFGSGSPSEKWGGMASQENPVWEIPNNAWGVQYEISHAKSVRDGGTYDVVVYVKSENFEVDQFKGEVVEFQNTVEPPDNRGCAHGCRYHVVENGRNWFRIDLNASYNNTHEHYEPTGFLQETPGVNRIMLLGMPAKGGVVSMTLKNEYKQIAARTVDYAYLDRDPDDWYGRSVEKVDPTHYSWVVRRNPSISGQPREAHNKSMKGDVKVPAFIKNGPYVSVGELQYVRKAEDFENIAAGGGSKSSGLRTISSIANMMGTSPVRLPAAGEGVERIGNGWHDALGKVSTASGGTVSSSIGRWEQNQWKGHWLRFLSGPMRGEMYPVFGNSRTDIQLNDPTTGSNPKSAPGRKPLRPGRGDMFCLGPGYRTPFCYTRQPNESCEWIWRNKVPVPGKYNLYVFGLNDAINTTEFLEENYNASLDIDVWNYIQEKWETLGERQRYHKEDSIYAGTINQSHISPHGDFRLRLESHDVAEIGLERSEDEGVEAQTRRQTGYAWFNYAVLTPVPVPGRINVNTASARLLSSLPGIDNQTALNIEKGMNWEGNKTLKPYRRIGDILKVKGMSPLKFEKCANLLSLGTSAYTIEAHAQSIQDTDQDGEFDENKDEITGERSRRYIVMRSPNDANGRISVVEKYSY